MVVGFETLDLNLCVYQRSRIPRRRGRWQGRREGWPEGACKRLQDVDLDVDVLKIKRTNEMKTRKRKMTRVLAKYCGCLFQR